MAAQYMFTIIILILRLEVVLLFLKVTISKGKMAQHKLDVDQTILLFWTQVLSSTQHLSPISNECNLIDISRLIDPTMCTNAKCAGLDDYLLR